MSNTLLVLKATTTYNSAGTDARVALAPQLSGGTRVRHRITGQKPIAWHGLVYSNHPREAAASSYLAIIFWLSKSGFTINETNLNFTYVSYWIYCQTKCGQSGIKIVYSYDNEDDVITRERKNVTSESTLSALLTSIQQGGVILFGYRGDWGTLRLEAPWDRPVWHINYFAICAPSGQWYQN